MLWYSISVYALLYPNSTFKWTEIEKILTNGYWMLFGDLHLDGKNEIYADQLPFNILLKFIKVDNFKKDIMQQTLESIVTKNWEMHAVGKLFYICIYENIDKSLINTCWYIRNPDKIVNVIKILDSNKVLRPFIISLSKL